MKKTCLLTALLALVAFSTSTLPVRADEKSAATTCFDKLKSLAGDWNAKGSGHKKSGPDLRIRVISGGTAIEELESPGTAHEMITVYHMDGDLLVLTHYCCIGNQPTMKATAGSTPDKMSFDCTGVSNMKSSDDAHMHTLNIAVLNKNHIQCTWTLFIKGKKSDTATFDVYRKVA